MSLIIDHVVWSLMFCKIRKALTHLAHQAYFYDFVFSIFTFLSFPSPSFVPVYCPDIGLAVV